MSHTLNPGSLNILLPTIGSAGDVHPVLALGVALQKRGHRATILTNPLFQELIEGQGLGFLPVGTIEDARAAIADPDLWHPRKGFEVVARRAILPAMAEVYRHIERHADDRTVVASSGIAFGARIAQERLGVPMATVHLQPSIIRSLVDQGMAGNVRISASQPMWFKRAFFRFADWLLIDRALKGPVNEFRATLGLPPVDRVMHRWMHSPQLVIGFFPGVVREPPTRLAARDASRRLSSLGQREHAACLRTRASFSRRASRRSSSRRGRRLRPCTAISRNQSRLSRELRRARDARHELPGAGATRSSAAREDLRLPAVQRRFCRTRRCSSITAVSARWRRPSRRESRISSCPTVMTSSTTPGASNSSASVEASRRRGIEPIVWWRRSARILGDGEGRARCRDYASRIDSDAAVDSRV